MNYKKIFTLILFFISSCFTNAQNVVDNLPYTYRVPFPYGYLETTINVDGTATSRICTTCTSCSGGRICQVCFGTGVQSWGEYMGLQPCMRCYGSGVCQSCGGKGFSIINTSTQYGITVGFDEHGNMYIAEDSQGGSSSRSPQRDKVEKIEYIPSYGCEANMHVYCNKCKKSGQRHIHILI